MFIAQLQSIHDINGVVVICGTTGSDFSWKSVVYQPLCVTNRAEKNAEDKRCHPLYKTKVDLLVRIRLMFWITKCYLLDLWHLQELPLMTAGDFSYFIWSVRRYLACFQRFPIHIFYRRDLENDCVVQMWIETPLCSRCMRITTTTPVNRKGLL